MQRHGFRAKGKHKLVVTTDSLHRLPVAADVVQRRFTSQQAQTALVKDAPP